MKSEIRHLADLPADTALPKSVVNPIKPEQLAGKHDVRLGEAVGMTQLGVNHLTLEPGSMSSLRHWLEGEDAFVFVLSGQLTLIDDCEAYRTSKPEADIPNLGEEG